MLISRSKTGYLRRNKAGFCAIHCHTRPFMLSNNPGYLQSASLSTGTRAWLCRTQWCCSDLSTMGCSAWEASLSNILWSGGCSEWSSSARAALHLWRRRAWSPASHMTCWFLSVCTRDCRMLATASWRSSACWNERKTTCNFRRDKLRKPLCKNNQRETTLGNQYTKSTVLSCVCTLQGQWTPASPSFLKIKGRHLRETNEVKLTQNDFYQTFPT